ncbi:SDR family oxidoreductase [Methylobacterium nonmethylotrophicum]|uniref:SDR family NAD(P)-dependent oxidoreductase n=1 Tax=Methylobacterium nonmethylotrophicum TaxID=1141884 RepID=A0A4Z0NKT3_9HYPH|nr:SDR family oxidoreductase [Methylobacterium nonmethylotrophicum]TGD97013.1 SDR family NAD(P)-dependent oxidoreductase [Methylobacterium nonmethylotrophicum]
MRVLILGGYGVFGGRLVRLLQDVSVLDLIICGRSLARAQAFCAAHRGAARVEPLVLDRADIAETCRTRKPDLVVDASGPFQEYGADPYRVIEACIAAGVDYLDFADGADFVAGVSRFDEEARAAGVAILSGVSSFPVLTAAVLRKVAADMEIRTVEGGVAPSPHAGIGLNVMRAVAGCAGGPVRLLRGGRPVEARGLTESRRFTVAVPGYLPLRNLRFSLVDVPDLQVLPPEHPAMTDIWMGAGPVPDALHRVLNLLARARARFGLPAFTPFAPLFHAVLNRLRFGEHRGGMVVSVRGRLGGRDVVRSWHLLAEGDDGPLIPSMAIEALIRKRLRGERPAPGARSAVRALELEDYEASFARRAIVFGFRDDTGGGSLYRGILGPALDTLPTPVSAFHEGSGSRRWTGSAGVRRGTGLVARLLCATIGFPDTARNAPVTVIVSPEHGGERWTRTIGEKTFASVQSAGTGRDRYLLVERFGVVAVAIALVRDGKRLVFVTRRWSILGIPMPRSLLPTGETFETEIDGRFAFDVTIRAPLVGLIVAYRGTLEPAVACPTDRARPVHGP